jgi:hypothetical protein
VRNLPPPRGQGEQFVARGQVAGKFPRQDME